MSDNWGNLISCAQSGDSRAWSAIIEHLRSRLRARAARELPRRLRQRVDPSDVVQQSLAEAWQGRAKFRGTSRPELEKWLLGILDHNLQDEIRKHRAAAKRSVDQERLLIDLLSSGVALPDIFVLVEPSPRSQLAHEELILQIVDSISNLPAQQGLALRLRYFERCSLADMSNRLHVSENAAAQLLHRALCNLREFHRGF
jgi:RNA polymerase sigma-70 factor (ECF subfamily)